jgi:protoheme IX farnesyltransferase
MSRTRSRPLVSGQLTGSAAFAFAAVLGVTGLGLLAFLVNFLTAILTFATLIGYGLVYTLWLKRATPQNIVIGGLAGAAPPLLGWAAVTNHVTAQPLLLTLIIFLWTPPHFWALAIARRDEYARAGIPMLPVTHGPAHTRLQMLFYTVLLFPATSMPFLWHMSGVLYLTVALLLDTIFLAHVLRLILLKSEAFAMRTFKWSVQYLMWLFAALLADHYLILSK